MSSSPTTNAASSSSDAYSALANHHVMKKTSSEVVDVKRRIDELKEGTRRVLVTTSDPRRALELVDAIQRLGIGYHFEEEIKDALERVAKVLPDDDLYLVALNFRLRRHNGLRTNPPADVFQQFMDANGELKKSSSEDTEGLLSLYEASFLGSSEEDILLHAKEITTRQLNGSVTKLCSELHKKVIEALKLPRHMRMERIEARRYIEEYGIEVDHHPIVLELAKFDYNEIQSVLRRELVEVTRWWEQLGLSGKLSFVRDRHVECLLWALGVLPEPSFSGIRIELAKIIAILLVIDDVYDTYGSYDDLVILTKVIQRWDLSQMEQLPEYMKVCYTELDNINSEVCDKVLKERGLSAEPFLCKTWTDLVEAYMVEVEWEKGGRIPMLKEYIDNGITTSGTYVAMVYVFFLISDQATVENMQHILEPYPKCFTLAGTILRLWDDLGTVKEEQERGSVVSSIHLLMKEKKLTSEEEGRQEILRLINGLWNDLNSELVKSDARLFPIIKVAMNMCRACQVVYQHDEKSYLSNLENHVQSLFNKPIDM